LWRLKRVGFRIRDFFPDTLCPRIEGRIFEQCKCTVSLRGSNVLLVDRSAIDTVPSRVVRVKKEVRKFIGRLKFMDAMKWPRVIEPWPTIFLSVSHPLCRSRVIRALSPTIDALATMILSIARLTNSPVPLILIRRELLQSFVTCLPPCAGSSRLELFFLRTRLQSWSWEQDLPGCVA
jgi:hypothetical protein